MLPIHHGYVTHVNLSIQGLTRERRACVLAETDAGDTDDRSDHSRSGHRTD